MKRLIILVVFQFGLMILPFTLMAEEDIKSVMTQVIPPSPNVSSLTKFGDIPVSYYSGMPQIDIPVYTIKQGNITIPISLSYFSGGIKISEISSAVGAGWSLNAGGVVGKQIVGGKDKNGYFINFPLPQSMNWSLYSRYGKGMDTEPDIFTYNFLGHVGKFIITKDNKAHLMPYSPLKIDYSLVNGLEKIIITDTEGTRYFFDELEFQENIIYQKTTGNPVMAGEGAMNNSDYGSVQGYYLSKIIDVNGNTIELEYELNSISYKYPDTYTRWLPKDVTLQSKQWTQRVSNNVNINSRRISKMIFNSGEVNFSYSLIREDIQGDKMLDQIIVKNKNGNIIKKVKLAFSCLDQSKNWTVATSKIPNRTRPFLDSITEFGEDGQSNPPHKFTYENSLPLSDRLSEGGDIWGFNNGVNAYSMPDKIADMVDYIPYHYTRLPNFEYAKQGSLVRIDYPTGGATTFTYEQPRYDFGQASPSFLVSKQTDKIRINKSNISLGEFTTKSLYQNKISISVSNLDTRNPYTLHLKGFEIVNKQTNAIVFTFTPDNSSATCTVNSSTGIKDCTFTSVTNEKAGTYIIRATANQDYIPTSENPSYDLVINWKDEEVQDPGTGMPGPGIRIKSITDFNNSQIATTSNFTYEGGVLIGKSNYLYDIEIGEYVHASPSSTSLMLDKKPVQVITQNSNVPLSSTQGAYIGYQKVIRSTGANGAVEYYYTSGREYPDVVNEWIPFHPTISYDWQRGLLLKEIYKQNDGKTVKIIENRYKVNIKEYIDAIKIRPKIEIVGTDALPDELQRLQQIDLWFGIKSYQWPIGYMEKQQTIMTENGVETIESFLYDTTYCQTKEIKQSTSVANRLISKTYKYPTDISYSTIEPYKSMVLKNIISPVIESTTSTNENVISAGKTSYKDWGSGKILPENIQQGVSQSTLEPRLTYHNYDSHGNPLYISKDNADKVVYLWSYNYQYPVAEIKNATYEDVKNALGMDPETLAASANPDMSKVNDLRKAASLSKAQVTTYTYKPLVGMASTTDPRGITTYYEYDAFNRLKEIYTKDVGGTKQVIERYDYNYKK